MPAVVASVDALQGSLREFPVDVLVEMLARKGRTGSLTLEGGSEVWLSEGRIYLARSAHGSAVSTVMIAAGVGTMSEIEEMLASDGSDGTILDRVLARDPQLEPSLRKLLGEFTLNSLFEMLVPSDASFRFEPGRRHHLGDNFASDTKGLVAQARQRVDIWRRIAGRVPSTTAVFALPRALPTYVARGLVTPDDWYYLSLTNGHNTVADIITQTGGSAFRVCSTLYRLLTDELIEEVAPPTSDGPTGEGADDAIPNASCQTAVIPNAADASPTSKADSPDLVVASSVVDRLSGRAPAATSNP